MTTTLYHGDALEIMGSFASCSVDAVIADPPYSINTKSDGSGKLNPWADRVNAAFWYREWIGEAKRILKPSGCLWSFLNWRSMTTFQKASDDIGWPIESLLIWDKAFPGTGSLKGLRSSYEMVALWAGDRFAIPDRGLLDIQRFKWSTTKPNGHPAEKPVSLVQWLIEISTKPGEVIFDPFTGSGTTAEACIKTGRNFIGSEIDPNWHKYAINRAERVEQQIPLFESNGPSTR